MSNIKLIKGIELQDINVELNNFIHEAINERLTTITLKVINPDINLWEQIIRGLYAAQYVVQTLSEELEDKVILYVKLSWKFAEENQEES